MPSLPLPAFCWHCPRTFDGNVLIAEGTPTLRVEGSTSPCPTCGKWGRIQDGDYTFDLLVLQAMDRATERQRRALASELEAFDPGEDLSELSRAISRINGPWDQMTAWLDNASSKVGDGTPGGKAVKVASAVSTIWRIVKMFIG